LDYFRASFPQKIVIQLTFFFKSRNILALLPKSMHTNT
jgi:hypothetical protein